MPGDSTRLHAQGWRSRASWAETAHAPDIHVPLLARGRQLDLADHQIDHRGHEVAFVRHVVVQGHRLDTELTGELAHRERLDSAVVCEADRSLEHAVPGEGQAGLGVGVGSIGIDKLTVYV